jgi:hypothetical protein
MPKTNKRIVILKNVCLFTRGVDDLKELRIIRYGNKCTL